jgi:hypothetical protein
VPAAEGLKKPNPGRRVKWSSHCKTVQWLLNNFSTELPRDPAITLLGTDTKEVKTHIQTKT